MAALIAGNFIATVTAVKFVYFVLCFKPVKPTAQVAPVSSTTASGKKWALYVGNLTWVIHLALHIYCG
jgi:hypothetical protein